MDLVILFFCGIVLILCFQIMDRLAPGYFWITLFLAMITGGIRYCTEDGIFKRKYIPVDKKAIIITGCDSGIGLEAAQVFHKLGFTVFACCLSSASEGATLLAQLDSERLIVLEIDVTDEDKVKKAFYVVEKHCKDNEIGLWSLINNAGICIGGDVEWQTWDQCEKQMNVNFLGMVRMVKTFLPLIKLSKGRIVNISSVFGRFAYPKFTIYSATKFAIEGFSDGLRIELHRHGVKVLVVAPGDHARITNIMKFQKERAKEQWDSFSDSYREEVGDEFWTTQSQICAKAGLTSFTHFKDSPVMRDLKFAVMETTPKNHYTSTSIKYQILFFVFRNLPSNISDSIIHKVQEKITNGEQVESIRPQ